MESKIKKLEKEIKALRKKYIEVHGRLEALYIEHQNTREMVSRLNAMKREELKTFSLGFQHGDSSYHFTNKVIDLKKL